MACGMPVICTELGTGTSYVNRNGRPDWSWPPTIHSRWPRQSTGSLQIRRCARRWDPRAACECKRSSRPKLWSAIQSLSTSRPLTRERGTHNESSFLTPHSSPLTPRLSMSHFIFDARTATDRFPGIGRYVRELTSALMPLLTADEKVTMLSNPAGIATWDALQPRAGDARPPPGSSRIQLPIQHRATVANSTSAQAVAGRRANPLSQSLLRHAVPSRSANCPDLLRHYAAPVFTRCAVEGETIFRLATTLALRAASSVVAVSEAARSDLTRSFHIPLSRVTVTPLAAGSHFRPQSAPEVDRTRGKYGLPDCFILYVGINKPHKTCQH